MTERGYRLAYGLLQDRSAAEDTVQEAALKAWRKLHQLRRGALFGPWFLGIVVNQARSTRRRITHPISTVSDAVVTSEGPERLVVRNLDLGRALAKLPHEQRSVLVLYYYLDLPAAEVAAVLGISTEAVRVRVHRACRRLLPALQVQIEA
jgi:RNA polymerase sigma-70 factor (ECF subfamily)